VWEAAANYSTLEYNLDEGTRGSRHEHIETLLKKITGAEAAMAVNNNAAAVLLCLSALTAGKDVIVSRGELVEIGGSFRVPEIMEQSGAHLLEVGTTNKTHLWDYENAINENTAALMKVHTSNYKIFGFTQEVESEELVELGRKLHLPVIEDLGSGVLLDLSKYGFPYEPTVQSAVKAGMDVVTFSGDKMLGGPQAGIIVGKKEYIEKIKKNQLTRALRIDKMTLAALEGTLKYYMDEEAAVKNLPTLYMILSPKEEHKKRAQRLKNRLQKSIEGLDIKLDMDYSMVGGGSMPTEKISTYVLKIKSSTKSIEHIDKSLRSNTTPIIVRIYNNEIIMDIRTIFDKDFDTIVEAFKNIV
jgi:L-seryl-tRNA(Ser) seleniumtransferase